MKMVFSWLRLFLVYIAVLLVVFYLLNQSIDVLRDILFVGVLLITSLFMFIKYRLQKVDTFSDKEISNFAMRPLNSKWSNVAEVINGSKYSFYYWSTMTANSELIGHYDSSDIKRTNFILFDLVRIPGKTFISI